MRILIICITAIFLSSFAYAEQCKSLNKIQANISKETILHATKNTPELLIIDNYCEHCMDDYPRPIVVDSLEIEYQEYEQTYSIVINDHTYDIAYIYVNNINLAHIVGCKTVGVSTRIF